MGNLYKIFLTGLGLCFAVACILLVWLPFGEALRAALGGYFLFFVPGFVWTYVFWKEDRLPLIERITLSVVFSITALPALVYYLNKFGMPINTLSLLALIAVVSLAGIGFTLKFRKKSL